jgi:hypothetical protein
MEMLPVTRQAVQGKVDAARKHPQIHEFDRRTPAAKCSFVRDLQK